MARARCKEEKTWKKVPLEVGEGMIDRVGGVKAPQGRVRGGYPTSAPSPNSFVPIVETTMPEIHTAPVIALKDEVCTAGEGR